MTMKTKGGGGPTGAPLDYYDDLSDSDGFGAVATIVFQDSDGGVDYRLAPTSMAGASDVGGANIRGGNGSWVN